jgi:HEAT repeat protein
MLHVVQPVQKKTVRHEPQGVPLVPLVMGWSVNVPASRPTRAATVSIPPPVDVGELGRVAATSSSAKQRDRAMDQLVALGPGRAGQILLDLLANDQTAASATEAIYRNPAPWIESLFAALGDPRMAVRWSSANALARIDGPAVTARLANLADADVHRREAVAALVRIHTPQSQQFIASAMHSRELSSIVRSAIAQSQGLGSQTGAIQ